MNSSAIYLRLNADPLAEGWFNSWADGERFFSTPQGWILKHPERGLVFPLVDDETGPPFEALPRRTASLDDWIVGPKP